jgi:hypothetical protein
MKKITSIIIALLFITFNAFAVDFIISKETVKKGSIARVKISTKGFNNLIGVQLSVNFDPALLQYESISIPNAEISKFYDVNITNVQRGSLPFLWTETSGNKGITLAENEVFLQVSFRVIGDIGSVTPVSISNNPTPLKAVDQMLKYAPVTKTDGSVTITKIQTPIDIEIKKSFAKEDGNTNIIGWNTTGGYNQVQIEKSTNGSDWVSLGIINEKDNHFKDAPTANDLNYYRLKMMNSDHEVMYSNIVVSKLKSNITLTLKAANQLKINGFDANESVQLVVTDLSGHAIFQQKITADTEGGAYFQMPNSSTRILLVTAQSAKQMGTFKILMP